MTVHTEKATWPVLEVDRLSASTLGELFDNSAAAVRIPRFLEQRDCDLAVEAIQKHGFELYKDVSPPIGKIGITQIEHQADRTGYLTLVDSAENVRRSLFSDTVDPVVLVTEQLEEAWGGTVTVARENDGQAYFAGVVRLIGQARLHSDWAPRDARGWSIADIRGQLAWNIYLATPTEGGETIIYDTPWDEALERFSNPDTYGYQSEAVKGARYRRIAPRAGELVLFNPRNLHAVTHSDTGLRITVSSFIGLSADGNLWLWS